ncbi:ABC transporter substrate-binding protein [Halobaculum magnesiiphilum]|uniref:ABC transporter substrate-binding protein n=1 Tax=Halobaculum magnesiiphilum TaxID=1017351 RepID=A0A8T8WGT5_9EURY|nr:ABC transporter substrate-binding protein [Halobaculum magnesiiphilum]QZP38954.1 ABC transporter substrate-binding protein [Halobaculum magnesiiphilum]
MTNEGKQYVLDRINRRSFIAGTGAAGVTALAGCAGGGDDGGDETTEGDGGNGGGDTDDSTPTPEESTGGTLNLAQVKSPIEFDPVVLNDVPSDQVSQLIFDSLYAYGEGTGIGPSMATGEPEISNEGQRYVVEINGDATFQNGDPVTAEDVKYSFEAPVDEETENASEVNMIDSITAVDEKTVQFDLLYPYGAFMTVLAGRDIVPMSVREEDKDAFNTSNPVGSGPFEFDSWQEGDYVDLVRNDDYWGEPVPNLAKIHFTPVEEATTRVTTLRNGENDVIEEIPPKLYSTVRSIEDASIDEVPGIGYFYLAFNCNEGPTADPRVREAIDYCFSMDDAVANYVEPTGVRQYSPFPASIAEEWEFPVDQWSEIPHDKNIDEATALFDEAGVSMDYSWRIIVPPDDKREQIGISVSNGLKEAGFSNVSVQRLDWGAFLEQYVTGSEDDYNMYTLGWSGSPDPDAFTYYMFGRTEDTLGVTNGSYYGANSERGKEAAEKLVTARESAERAERKQLYTEAVTTILEDRAHLPAYNLKNSFGVKEYVNNFAAHPVDSFHLASESHNVSVDK